MKHIFIVNPVAGGGKRYQTIINDIEIAAKEKGICYQIYTTSGIGNAVMFVREQIEKFSQEHLRFYACGGDGTLNEVVNGAAGSEAEVAMIPTGTGNDFPSSFAEKQYFGDIKRQIEGKAVPIDLIECKAGESVSYCVNMVNIGFDSDVVMECDKLKNVIKGSASYILSLAVTLMKKLGKEMEITLDSQTVNGSFLLTAISNGRFCGGGFQAAPKAQLCDGLMDVGIVKKVSRFKFLSLVGAYRKGTHIDNEKCKDIVIYRKCKQVRVKAKGDTVVSVDGEISPITDMTFTISPAAVRFVLPEGCAMAEGNA